MPICSDKPASLPPLDVLGLEPLGSPKLVAISPQAGICFPATNNGSMDSKTHFMGNFGTGGTSPTISGSLTHTNTRSGFCLPTDLATSVPLHKYAGTRRGERKKGSWQRRHSPDSPEMVDYGATQSFPTGPVSPTIPAGSRLNPVAPTFVPKKKIMLGNQDGDRVKPTIKPPP